MTLEDIDKQLPNGLHDAQLLSLKHDYQHTVVTLDFEFDLLMSADPEASYRRGEILFVGVFFCAVDPPAKESSFLLPGSLCITSFNRTSDRIPKDLYESLPLNSLCYSIFNRDWYSEIHIAASDCSFRWLGEATSIRLGDHKSE